METSAAGIELLEAFEGLSLKAYKDSKGVWTIGYGTTGPWIKPDTEITQQQAEALLVKGLEDAENTVNHLVKTPVSQKQFDAMVCLVYNIGSANFKTSTVLRCVNQGQFKEAAEGFLKFNKARINGVLTPLQGLTNRRRREKALFLEGCP